MKLKDGRITMLVSGDGCRIELHDNDASITFAHIQLSVEQFCQAMGRLGYTKCDIEVRGLDRLNKKMTNKSFEFELPKNWDKVEYGLRNKALKRMGKQKCPDGWEPDLYFKSQDSLFTKDGKNFARMTIRKWE